MPHTFAQWLWCIYFTVGSAGGCFVMYLLAAEGIKALAYRWRMRSKRAR